MVLCMCVVVYCVWYGLRTACVWLLYGVSMVCVWCCVLCVLFVDGFSMVFGRCLYCWCMSLFVWLCVVVCNVCVHGLCMVVVWLLYGLCMSVCDVLRCLFCVCAFVYDSIMMYYEVCTVCVWIGVWFTY